MTAADMDTAYPQKTQEGKKTSKEEEEQSGVSGAGAGGREGFFRAAREM